MGPYRVDYSKLAASYDRRYAQRRYPGLLSTLIEFCRGGDRLLEIGCGTGHWLAELQRTAITAVGLDPSPEMLAVARRRKIAAQWVRGCAERLPFASATFDRVAAIHAAHHFRDGDRFAQETARVLQPGGRVLIIELDPSRRLDQWYVYDYFEPTRDWDEQRYPGTAMIAQWLTSAGLSNAEVSEADRLQESEDAEQHLARGGADPTSNSQLAQLSPTEYRRGVQRIQRDIAQANVGGQTLTLHCDLRLYATQAEKTARR